MESSRIDTSTYQTFSPIVGEYLNAAQKDWLPDLFNMESAAAFIDNKSKSLTFDRSLLVERINAQYKDAGIEILGSVKDNLESLVRPDTYTVTTGHQLCIFTGPLYFPIKIIHTLKLAEKLSSETGKKVVPVFWLASEDHDFEEINHIHLFNKKIDWQTDQSGAVGRFKLSDFSGVLDQLNEIIGEGDNAKGLSDLIHSSYDASDLKTATRRLVHSLFEKQGLIILDGDDPKLKALFGSQMKKELTDSLIKGAVDQTNNSISQNFKVQVNPRSVNLFYLSDSGRFRIEREGDHYLTINGDFKWTQDEIIQELNDHPERFSPNVLMRPIYQEYILPNLAYVGGAGELAYWLQMKEAFKTFELPFPGLVLRNSVLWLDRSIQKKMGKLSLSQGDLFTPMDQTISKMIGSEDGDQLESERQKLSELYLSIEQIASEIDPTLGAYVQGQEKQAQKQLEQISGKIKKVLKRNNEQSIQGLENLLEKLFPGGNLHERYDNFVPYYLRLGTTFFDVLKSEMDVFDHRLIVIAE